MSEFADLANATLKFNRVLSTKLDPSTGNQIPDLVEDLSIRAYFKKSAISRSLEYSGVPVGDYKIKGYTVGRLPLWCENPTNPAIECTVDHLGSGYFYHEGKIAVVFDEISAEGDTTPIQGYFTAQGSGSNAGFI